jgi:tetrahydroxynaphthalene reductase
VSFGHLEDITEVSLVDIPSQILKRGLTFSQEEFDRVFSLNTRGQFFVAQQAYKHLSIGGRIILMSSNTAINFTVPKHSLHSASKAAINAFVRVLAKDCGKKKITVDAVAPGGIVTDMLHETAKDYLQNADHLSKEEILNVSSK